MGFLLSPDMTATEIIERLKLEPHPEGGYFRETYRAGSRVKMHNGEETASATLIYYLLKNAEKSSIHRLDSDEMWLFHGGFPLDIFWIDHDRDLRITTLGSDFGRGEQLQFVVPAQTWFGAKLKNEDGYALVSCAVAPGFRYSGFEMANKIEMKDLFPDLFPEIEFLIK